MECIENHQIRLPVRMRKFFSSTWTVLFLIGFLAASVGFAQQVSAQRLGRTNFTRPTYVPSVDQQYFFGEGVYPDPNTPPEPFQPAPGVSTPRSDTSLRAERRRERFANLRPYSSIAPVRETTTREMSEDFVKLPNSEPTLPEQMRITDTDFSSTQDFQENGLLDGDGSTQAIPLPPEVFDAPVEKHVTPEPAKKSSESEKSQDTTPSRKQDIEILPVAFFSNAEGGDSPAYPSRRKTTEKQTVSPQVESAKYTEIRSPKTSSKTVETPRPLAMPTPNALVQQMPVPQVQSQVSADTVPQAPTEILPWKNPSAPWFTQFIHAIPKAESQMLARVLNDNWSQTTLLQAAVLASRPQDATQIEVLQAQYRACAEKLRSRIALQDSESVRAEKILQFLHEEVFREYQLENTTLENLFHGRYNCVTATVLYCSLGRQFGLNVVPVELPGHAMCRVIQRDGNLFDVETTCKTWFQYRHDAMTRNRIICDLIRQANGASVEVPQEVLLSQVRPITDRILLAKIYYNQGVDLLAIKDFSRALEANAIALLLDPQSETTHGNLLATINNWAIDLCRDGKYEHAAALLRLGIRKEPDYATFRNNHIHVYHRWVEALYRDGQYAKAMQVVQLAISEQPQEKHFQELQKTLQISSTEKPGSTN